MSKRAVFEDMLAVMLPVFLRTVQNFDEICPKGVTILEKKSYFDVASHSILLNSGVFL